MGATTPMTRHAQLASELRSTILSGGVTIGSLLPTEEELCRQHQVSRTTVREALRTLASEGLVMRRQGRGTVVITSTARATPAYRSASQIDAILQYETGSSVEMVHAGLFAIPQWIQQKSNRTFGGKWIKFVGTVTSASEQVGAVSAVDIYVRPNMDESISIINQNKSSFFREIQTAYGIKLAWVEQAIEATLCGIDHSAILKIGRRDPCLRILRRFHDTSGEVFAISLSSHSGKSFSYSMEIDIL